jgi:hypothetical protein
MAVSVSLLQTRSIDTNSQYVVNTTVSAATGVDPALFVYKAQTNVYDHVATLNDLTQYPSGATQGAAFYRLDNVTQTFSNVEDAISAAAAHKTLVAALATDYGIATASFLGSETTVFTG